KDAFNVRTTVFVQEQQVPQELELDAYDNEAIHFIGYDENNEPVAASRLRFVEDFGKLERVCVLKKSRGKSYGKQMIHRMEAHITANGYTKAKLHAQVHATHFYKQLGYLVVSD